MVPNTGVLVQHVLKVAVTPPIVEQLTVRLAALLQHRALCVIHSLSVGFHWAVEGGGYRLFFMNGPNPLSIFLLISPNGIESIILLSRRSAQYIVDLALG